MEDWMRSWAGSQEYSIPRKEFCSPNTEELIYEISEYLAGFGYVILRDKVNVITRETHDGFYMRLHRDDYIFSRNAYKDGIRDDRLWKPIYQTERPKFTAVWYHSDQGKDFVGGNFRFHDGYVVTPHRNTAILFDSNDMHEVTLQSTKAGIGNSRKVTILKFFL